MKYTLKVFGILLMSMVLVTSCGKDDKDEPDTPNTGGITTGGVTTVDEMIKTATYVFYINQASYPDYLEKTIADAGYVNQLRDLVTKGKTYKKIIRTQEMQEGEYMELVQRKYYMEFFTGNGLLDKNDLQFHISEDGKQVTVLTQDKTNGDYFELEGTLDIAKIVKLINEAPADE